MLGAVIQTVTVFDTRRGTAARESIRVADESCSKTCANALIATITCTDQYCKSTRNSAVQELLSVGWGSA
jgi:hypothetical protein